MSNSPPPPPEMESYTVLVVVDSRAVDIETGLIGVTLYLTLFQPLVLVLKQPWKFS